MPVWSQVDPVAQIAGIDAYGLIKLIVQRAETVRSNRHECAQLAEQVLTIDGILPQVQREVPEMHRVLGNLETTLREACVLVSACQGSSYFRRFLRSDKHAEQFWRLREKIEFYLQLFPVISHIDTTRRLVRIINGIESPTTENMLRSTSNRSGRTSRSNANEDLSSEWPHARTEPFAVINMHQAEDSQSHRGRESSENDSALQLTQSTQSLIGIKVNFSKKLYNLKLWSK